MTDNEIIKALECCSKTSQEICIKECPIFRRAGCIDELHKVVFTLISRQKEEIERYKGVIKILENDVQTSRSETIREFAEKLKDNTLRIRLGCGCHEYEVITKQGIDYLLKEMVGKDDA
ncbi:MAG: hypothetical protein IJX77_10255 [Ruminococcus sp.]|nr:hypothetical protein [Ruminococcus sp.]